MSTSAVDVEDRLAFWEHYNAEALVGLTCRTYADEGLEASQLNLRLGEIRVADIAGNQHLIERPPALIRSHPKDAAFVSVVLEGEGFFYHPEGCQQLRAGDMLLYRTNQPYLLGFSTRMRKLLIDVPGDLFEQRCGPNALDRPLFVPGQGDSSFDPTARTLRRVLMDIVDDAAVSPHPEGAQVLDLVQLLTTGQGTSVSTSRLRAAKSHIADHLTDPGLCADTVSRAVGVTPRHLNRAFASEGTTVTRFVQARRLEAARVDLTSSSPVDLRVADIAFRWGFGSQAHFTRLFRARFGCTPSDVRSQRSWAPPA